MGEFVLMAAEGSGEPRITRMGTLWGPPVVWTQDCPVVDWCCHVTAVVELASRSVAEVCGEAEAMGEGDLMRAGIVVIVRRNNWKIE